MPSNVRTARLVIAPTTALRPQPVHDRTLVSCLVAAQSVAPPSVPQSNFKGTMAERQLLARYNQSACGGFTIPAPVLRLPSSMRPFSSPCRRRTRTRGQTRKSEAATSSDTDINLKRAVVLRQNARSDTKLSQGRRASLAALAAAAAAVAGLPSGQAHADDLTLLDDGPIGGAPEVVSEPVPEPALEEAEKEADVDLTITDRVYLDIGVCPEALNRQRRVGDKSALCSDPQALGRIVIGLYGNHLPTTTANFKRAVMQGLYTGTIFHRILPGAYVQAGRQGSKRLGEVFLPKDSQAANPELTQGRSYRIPHLRPGSVSLVLGQNDDYADIKQARDYRNAQFLITTGPGPVPSLDEENIVFGRVLDGFGTVNSIAQVPTFSPNTQARQMNAFANFLGDGRAKSAKAQWGRPLKAVIITGGGTLSDV